jgi:hypothetical protein
MRRYALLAAIVVVFTFTPTATQAATVDVLVLSTVPSNPTYKGWDDLGQAEEDVARFLAATRNSGALTSEEGIRLHLDLVPLSVDESLATDQVHLSNLASDEVDERLLRSGWDVALVYNSASVSSGIAGAAGWRAAVIRRGSTVGAHELGHIFSGRGEQFHLDALCTPESRGLDSVPWMCSATKVVELLGTNNAEAVASHFAEVAEFGSGPEPPGGLWWGINYPLPRGHFEFKTRFSADGREFIGQGEFTFNSELVAFSGALEGRPEIYIRVIGPRPNGHLMVQAVKFSPTRIELWVRQTSTGKIRYYDLSAVPASGDTLPGLQDNEAFLP